MVNVQEEFRSGLDSALSQVGDRWSLLVVEALLDGPRRFGQLEVSLPGIATNVLSQRLKALERRGLVVASRYSTRPPRFEYTLTAPGRDLAGAVNLLAHWGTGREGVAADGGAAGESGGSPVHGRCGTPLEPRWYCPTCDEVATPEDDGPGYI